MRDGATPFLCAHTQISLLHICFSSPFGLFRFAPPPGRWGLSGEVIDCFALVAEPSLGCVRVGCEGDVGASTGFRFSFAHLEMLLSVSAPCFDGKGESFRNLRQHVELRLQVTHLGPAKRASAQMLHMGSVAGERRDHGPGWGQEDFDALARRLCAGRSGLCFPGSGPLFAVQTNCPNDKGVLCAF